VFHKVCGIDIPAGPFETPGSLAPDRDFGITILISDEMSVSRKLS